jgi:hypothetical protein
VSLHALDCVGCQHRDYAEEQHHDGVLGPGHLVRLIDAGEAIDQALDRPKDAIGEGALALEGAGHVDSERLRAYENEREEETDLKPAVGGHCSGTSFKVWLKLFWAQKRIDEVDEQRDGYGAEEKSFNRHLLSFVPSRSQPMVYAMARRKKATLAAMHPISHMASLLRLKVVSVIGKPDGRGGLKREGTGRFHRHEISAASFVRAAMSLWNALLRKVWVRKS